MGLKGKMSIAKTSYVNPTEYEDSVRVNTEFAVLLSLHEDEYVK